MIARFKNIFILFLCLLRAAFCGRADQKIANPKKILVVHKSKLGDAVCATPVLRAVKAKYPQSKIYVLGLKIVKELLAGSPDVDEFIFFEESLFGLVKKIKKDAIVHNISNLETFNSVQF